MLCSISTTPILLPRFPPFHATRVNLSFPRAPGPVPNGLPTPEYDLHPCEHHKHLVSLFWNSYAAKKTMLLTGWIAGPLNKTEFSDYRDILYTPSPFEPARMTTEGFYIRYMKPFMIHSTTTFNLSAIAHRTKPNIY
jgi:hypothetical protein